MGQHCSSSPQPQHWCQLWLGCGHSYGSSCCIMIDCNGLTQAAHVRQRSGQAIASTCLGCRRQVALLHKRSTHVPTGGRVNVMQREIKQLCPGSIPTRFSSQNVHFGSITSLCFANTADPRSEEWAWIWG